MFSFIAVPITVLASSLLGATPDLGSPERFGAYYSGPPCPTSRADRTFSQF